MALLVTSYDWPFDSQNPHKTRFDRHYDDMVMRFQGIPRVVLRERSVDGNCIQESLQNFSETEIAAAKNDFSFDLDNLLLSDLRLVLSLIHI